MASRAPDSFPRGYSLTFGIAGAALVVAGLLLWWPDRGGPSTAQSDLGLALLGGGLAITAGFVVARAVFGAERRFDSALRGAEERRDRENLKFSLSLAESLDGADLRGRDLAGLRLHQRNLDGADLEDAILTGALFLGCSLRQARLRHADLRDARFGVGGMGSHCSLVRADLIEADLRGATLRADLRMANLRDADLRGADLRRAFLQHPQADEHVFLHRTKFDETTQWPEGIDPTLWGAIRV